MSKRKPLDIKKEILEVLQKERRISVKKLEKKVNTSYETILNNCRELEYFGFIKLQMSEEVSENGQHYLEAELLKQPPV